MHAEIAVARLLAGGDAGDRTDRLRELLERCAVLGNTGPRSDVLAQIASIKRFTIAPDPHCPAPALLLTLDVDSFPWPAGALPLFASVLDRYFRLSAPLLTRTRMLLRTPEGDLT